MTEKPGAPHDQPANINELAGNITGPVIQAREIHGGVHYHSATAPPVPSQLPATSPVVDRTEPTAALDAAVRSGLGTRSPTIGLVTGPAGIGKTAFTLSWAHQASAEFTDGRLFADLRGHSPDSPAEPLEVLGHFIRAFGTASEQLPTELAERAALYRTLTAGRRLLVVLDDAFSAAQVIPLLPASPHGVALVTSRWRLAGLVVRGARSLQLGPLTEDGALDLLAECLGETRIQAEPAAGRRLVELCAHHPLAIRVAAAQLVTRPNRPLAEITEAMAGERRRLLTMRIEDDMTIHGALTLSYRGLRPGAAGLYRLLGLHPGAVFDSRSAAALAGLPTAEASDRLGDLTDANLLDDVPGGRYRFHELTRLHAIEMCEQDEPAAERDAAERRLLAWYGHAAASASGTAAPYRRPAVPDPPEGVEPLGFAHVAEALDWMEAEFRTLLAVGRRAFDGGLFELTWTIASALWPLFLQRGYYPERLEVARLGLSAARHAGDRTGEAKMLFRTGMALRRLGHYDDAVRDFEQARHIWHELGNVSRVAAAERRIGLTDLARGRISDAIERFEAAMETYASLGEQRREAKARVELAQALTAAGREAEAAGQLRRAMPMLDPRDNPYQRARILVLLGRAEQDAALTASGLEAMREINSTTGQAEALEILGDLAARSGQAAEARRHYTEALRLSVAMRDASERLTARLAELDG